MVVSVVVGIHFAWEINNHICILSTNVPAGMHTLGRALEPDPELLCTPWWSLHRLNFILGVLCHKRNGGNLGPEVVSCLVHEKPATSDSIWVRHQ